ncbi:MAG: sulfotransferase [Pseudomonadota bacterium]
MTSTMRPGARAAYDALAKGNYERCAQLAAQLGGNTPEEQSETYYIMAQALEGVGKHKEAALCAKKAANLHGDGTVLTYLARLLVQLHDHQGARLAATHALKTPTLGAAQFDTLGNVFARLADHETAITAFEKAATLAPQDTEIRFNLATSCGFFGREQDAEKHFQRIIDQTPYHAKAWLSFVRLKRQKEHIPALQAALDQAEQPVDKVRLGYAAAKVAEDTQAYDAVVEHLRAANATHSAHHDTKITLDLENVAALQAAFSNKHYFRAPPEQAKADEGPKPIFVTGLPRTGTTLTDRILAAHPHVVSAGELQAMPLCVKEHAGTSSRAILDPATIEALSNTAPHALGVHYMARAQQFLSAETFYFIDKLPLNFLYIGFIARALPNAAIICLRRSPMDSIWSNYKHLFAIDTPYYRYSYAIETCARYYVAFDALMAFWKQLYPGRIFELTYEQLVPKQEDETRKLLAHCGLDWDDTCLDFHRQAAAVATPSSAQVRQPINASSIGRWRNYEGHLTEAKKILEAADIEAV